jgi:hypothetical protein
MSQDQQDLIRGRLTREQKERRTRIAALEANLKYYGQAFLIAGRALKGANEYPAQPRLEDVESLPDKAAVLDTLNELREERTRFDDLTGQLKRFDI